MEKFGYTCQVIDKKRLEEGSRPMTNQGCTYQLKTDWKSKLCSRPMTNHGCTYHF